MTMAAAGVIVGASPVLIAFNFTASIAIVVLSYKTISAGSK